MGRGKISGTMLAMISTTRCSPKMLPKRRSVRESTREEYRNARRRRKVFEIRHDALRLDALEVVVEPNRQRTGERDVDVAGRRAQAWDLSHQVAQQDEDED